MTPEPAGTASVPWGGRTARGVALLAILLIVAYPARALLTDPDVPMALRLAWVAAIVVVWRRPAWGAWLLVGLVPFLPIVPHVAPAVPHAIVHLVVVGLALPVLFRMFRGAAPVVDAPGVLLGLMVAIACASLAVALAAYALASPVTALAVGDISRLLGGYIDAQPGPHFPNRVVAFTAFADGLLAYLVVRLGVDGPSAHRLLRVAVGTAVVVSALGCVQAFTGTGLHPMWVQFDAGIRRINSTYFDPNALAAYLAMMLPSAVGLAGAAERGRERGAWLVGALVVSVALILTAGRMAVVAALVGLAILAVDVVRRNLDAEDPWVVVRRGFRRGIAVGGAAVVAAALALTVVGTIRDMRHTDQDSYLDTALYTLNLRQPLDEKLKGRLTFWRTMMHIIRDAPVFGMGVGTVFETFASYSAREGGPGAGISLSAHNTVLNVAGEMGAVGVGAWLAWLAVVYGMAFRRDAAETRSVAWMRVGLAAGLAAYGTTMLTGDRTILREDPVMFGAMVAAAAVLAPAGATRRPRWLRSAFVAVCVLLLATWPVRVADTGRRIALDRLDWGFYGSELDPGGEPFRWTGAWAVFHVSGSAGDIEIPVRMLAPWPLTVTVTIDGRLADRVVLDENDWHTLRYAVPSRGARSRFHRIELAVDPTFIPPNDGREIGVMVGRYRWNAAGAGPG